MDINLKEALIKKLIVHFVGSKNNLEAVQLSEDVLQKDANTFQVLAKSFLNKFTTAFELYGFHHATSLNYNEVYSYATELFVDDNKFISLSKNIAKHLYENSTHPKVKGGELYIALFDGILIENTKYQAIGLFKTENKSLFLQTSFANNQLAVEMEEGAEINKIDKGCLIVNSKKDEGLDVLLFDNQNRGEEALYWKQKFLGLILQANEFQQTNHLLTLTKQYITEKMESEFSLPKKDQIELLHKSLDYFRANENFDINDFQKEVFEDDEKIESFRNFGSQYTEQHKFNIANQFEISGNAVKKQMRIYKSVLKLDRNFHIYIHGNTDLIEKGVDNDGRKFYKLYYQDEA